MPKLTFLLKFLLIIVFALMSISYLFLKVKYATNLRYGNQNIKIERNQYGVPHIYGQSYKSVLYGWGYALAQDRLFQISFRRCMFEGKLSELFGEKSLKMDKMFREINLGNVAQLTAQNVINYIRQLKQTNESEYRQAEAFVTGINDYVSSLYLMPLDFQLVGLKWKKWQVRDMVLLIKILEWASAHGAALQYIRSSLLKNYTKEQVDEFIPYVEQYFIGKGQTVVKQNQITQQLIKLTRPLNISDFVPEQVEDMIKIGMPIFSSEMDGGSNCWVISGKHTANGKAMLGYDPHFNNALPGQWHQAEITYKKNNETINYIGVSMPGLTILVGQGDYLSFGMTVLQGDSQDLYHEKIQGQNYLLDGKWYPLKKRVEKIVVKDMGEIQYPVYQTHRGPLIHYLAHIAHFYEFEHQNISLAWVGYIPQTHFLKMAHLPQIKDHEGIVQMMEQSNYLPVMSFLYITADDHFGQFSIGVHPLRRHPHTGVYVKDGRNSSNDWIGIIKGREKINVRDPERGYVVAANNKQAGQLYQNNLLGVSAFTGRADRIERLIRQKIEKGHKFTMEEMMKMQQDTVDEYCLQIIGKLTSQLPENNLLISFNCDMSRKSYQATIYEILMNQIYKSIQPSQYNLAITLAAFHYRYRYILNGNGTLQFYTKLYNKTLEFCITYFGTEDHQQWEWGKIHRDNHLHRPFSNNNILKGFYERSTIGQGNCHTINIGCMNKLNDGQFIGYHQASFRMINSFVENSYWIVDNGVNQRFYSNHYDDQLKLYNKNKYLLMVDRKRPLKEEIFEQL